MGKRPDEGRGNVTSISKLLVALALRRRAAATLKMSARKMKLYEINSPKTDKHHA